jgi:ABC-type Fe3+ transport system permease subunit
MVETVVFIIFIVAIKFLLTKFLRKKYNIIIYPNSDRYINNTHKLVERVLIIIAITLIILSYFFVYLIIGIAFIGIILLLFQAYMEYKYEQEEKEYIITIVETFMFLIVIIGAPILYFA